MNAELALLPPLRIAGVGLLESRTRYDAALNAVKQIQVVALVEEDTRLARVLARELGRSVVFTDLTALRESDVKPDALLLALDAATRGPFLLKALDAGLPILCDAPFGVTLAEFDALLKTADTAGIPLVPAFARPFDPWIELVTQELAEEAIGTLRQVRCDWSFPTGGVLAVENGGEAEGRSWIEQLPQFACQTADLCRRWLGEAHTVSADIDLPGNANNLPARPGGSAALANLIVSHAAGQSTHHLSRSRGQHPLERYLFTGTNGEMELTLSAGETGPNALPVLRLQRTGHKSESLVPDVFSPLPPNALRQAEMLRHFAETARGLTVPRVTAADARAALEIVHAAYTSTLDSLKISLPLRRSPILIAP
jgi:predicted dehydrogenase